MIVYRVVSPRWSQPAEAFSGIGAERYGGRWNPKGVRLVYTSSSVELGLLENMVHAPMILASSYLFFSYELDEADLEILAAEADLPAAWAANPYQAQVQQIGEKLCRQPGRVLALRVPSAVLPTSFNVLLNPLHPRFSLDRINGPFVLSTDSRLLEFQRTGAAGAPPAAPPPPRAGATPATGEAQPTTSGRKSHRRR